MGVPEYLRKVEEIFMGAAAGEGKKQENKKEEILNVSRKFFIEQGYEKTSMRQIAAAADVSLGLVAYHFKTKRDIALEIVQRMYHRFAAFAKMYVNRHRNPILYSGLLVNLNYMVLSSEKYEAFYRDILRNDILLDVIAKSGVETYMSIRDNYRQDLSDEEAEKMGWYGNFISVSMERTLVLYDDSLEMMEGSIPDVIFKSYMGLWRFPDVDRIMDEVCIESQRLAEKILREHPEIYG